MNPIFIWDSTLRDGLQVPGVGLTKEDKIELARKIKGLGADYMEIGYPAVSEKAAKEVRGIVEAIGLDEDSPILTVYAQPVREELDTAYESLTGAKHKMLHVVVGASEQQMVQRMGMTKEQVLAQGMDALAYAKSLTDMVQYTIEDAGRADEAFVLQMAEAAARGGAAVINLTDTVGAAIPEVYGALFSKVRLLLDEIDPAILLSTHCHNDMGLAVANSLSAVKNGARKVECTVNGIGERAGLAALEEVAVALRYHQEYYQGETRIRMKSIPKVSQFVSYATGLSVQVNKAIIGANAFVHSQGMHSKNARAYEAFSPVEYGVHKQDVVINAENAAPALLREVLENILDYHCGDDAEFRQIFAKLKLLIQKKKQVFLHDLYFLLQRNHYVQKNDSIVFELKNFKVVSSDEFPSAWIRIRKGAETIEENSYGDGPIDALYTAIKNAVQMDFHLLEYKIHSVSKGKEALGRVTVLLEYQGEQYYAHSTDTDTIKASAIALLNGINNCILSRLQEA